jgi:2-dehydropantoate 2-reductase
MKALWTLTRQGRDGKGYSKSMNEKPRILIMGCGGIGGVLAGCLAADNTAQLQVVSSNPNITTAIQDGGLEVIAAHASSVSHISISVDLPPGPFDFILLATQPTQIEDAARQSLASLRTDGSMVVLANGLCEQRVAAICGPQRVIGAIVSFGATVRGHNRVERTSSGGITLGHIDGPKTPKLDSLATLLAGVGTIVITDNLQGARFSKLALNCAVTGLGTLTGATLGHLLTNANTRNLALDIMKETVGVSQAAGVKLEPIGGTFDLNWLADPKANARGPSHWLRHLLLLMVGFKYRKLRSSMLRAIAKGRVPSVDFVNGEVATLGRRHDVSVPLNREITSMIHRIGTGKLQPDIGHLNTLQAIRTHRAKASL